MNPLLKFVCLIGMLVMGTLLDGGLLLYGWQHIVIPTFHVHSITYAMACGLDTFVAYAIVGLARPEPESESDFPKWMTDKLKWIASGRFILFLMMLIVGWWIAS